MFCSEVPIRDTHKSPKIVCWLAHTVRRVFQTWKDTEWDASRGMEEIHEFCFKDFAAVCLFWNFFVSGIPVILLINSKYDMLIATVPNY